MKDTAPNSPQDFAFYAFGPNSGCCGPFQLDDDTFSMLSHSKTFTLAPGSYGFKEDFNNPVVVTGWTLASIVCTGGAATVDLSTMSFTANLAAGQNITCTFRNTPTTGTITIVKDAAPNNPQDFAFYSFGPNSGCCNPFQLDDDVDPTLSHSKTFTLAPGSYAFKEDFSNPVVVTGWTLAGITCSGGGTTVDLGTMSFTASLTAGQNITCTFRNTTPTGTIRIVKDATPNSLADFAFTSSVSNIGFALDDDASVSGASNLWPNSQTFTLAAGSYTFSEIATAGWGLTNIACLPAGSATTNISTGSITANLTAGQNITCTFVNKKVPPSSITIVKDAQPNDTPDFTFTSTGCCGPFQLDDDPAIAGPPNSQTFNLPPGTYSFQESVLSPWTVSSIACTPTGGTTINVANRSITVNLAVGKNITCTFVNTKPACTAWPMEATVNIYNPTMPFGPQTVHICFGGKVKFVNVNSGAPWSIDYLNGPASFPSVLLAATNNYTDTTAVLTMTGTYQYKINGNPGPGFFLPGNIIVH